MTEESNLFKPPAKWPFMVTAWFLFLFSGLLILIESFLFLISPSLYQDTGLLILNVCILIVFIIFGLIFVRRLDIKRNGFFLRLDERGIYFEQIILKSDLVSYQVIYQFIGLLWQVIMDVTSGFSVNRVERMTLPYEEIHAVFRRRGVFGTTDVVILPQGQHYTQILAHIALSNLLGDSRFYGIYSSLRENQRIIVVPGLSSKNADALINGIITKVGSGRVIEKDILPKAVSKSSPFRILLGVLLYFIFLIAAICVSYYLYS